MHKSWLHSVQILTIRQPTQHYIHRRNAMGNLDRTSMVVETERDWSSTKGKKWNWHLRVIGHLPTKLKRITWGGERWKENWRKTGTKLHVHLKDTDTFCNQPKPKKRDFQTCIFHLRSLFECPENLSQQTGGTQDTEKDTFSRFCSLQSVPQCAVSRWPLDGHRYLREAPVALVPPLMTH